MSDRPRDQIPAWLSALRALVRRSIALRGIAFVAIAIVGVLLFSLGVDRLFRLSAAARGVALVVWLGTLVWVAWRYLLRPFASALPDRLLADLAERRFPELRDRLRSAIEFRAIEFRASESRASESRASESRASESRASELRASESRASELRATEDLAHGDPDAASADARITRAMKDRVIEQADRQLRALARGSVIDGRRLLRSALGGGAGVLVIALLAVASPDTVAIWLDRNVFLGDAEWPYRTRLFVDGLDDHRVGVPRGDPLDVRVRAEGEDPVEVTIRLEYENESARQNLPREGDKTFLYSHAAVTEPFEFTVSGGDFRSKPYAVTILERPTVEELAVTLAPPAYTVLEPILSSGQIGELAGPAGSKLALSGRANKELRRAWIVAENREIDLAVDGRSFRGAFDPTIGGAVTIYLEDLERVPPDQLFQFSVHLIDDRAPKVRVRIDGLGPMISANARMPIEIDAKDDYKVEHLTIAHEIVDAENASTSGEDALDDPEDPSDHVLEDRVFEVGSLAIEPEKRLNVRIGAVDNDALAGAKTGYSSIKSFLVVPFDKLGAEFVRREEEQRRVLESLLEKEKLARDAVYELVGSAWKEEGELDEETIQKMLVLGRVERQQARQVSAVASAVQQILTEMENNRAGEAVQLGRLAELIIGPLQDLGETSMPAAAVELGQIRDNRAAGERVEQGLRLAERVEEHVATLERVIANMTRLESFTEIVKLLRVTIGVHDQAIDATQRNLERAVDDIFEDDSGGSFETDPPNTAPRGR